jgi:hypothetical protein
LQRVLVRIDQNESNAVNVSGTRCGQPCAISETFTRLERFTGDITQFNAIGRRRWPYLERRRLG